MTWQSRAIITAFESSPDKGAGLARDTRVRWALEEVGLDPDTQDRAERLKERVLAHPAVLDSAVSLWNALRRALLGSLRDPEGAVRLRLEQERIPVAYVRERLEKI